MNATVVSAAVIIEGEKVLVTQRLEGAHLGGMWEFPGGKIEDGESPVEALVRELREELGVVAEVGAVIEVTFCRYPGRDVLLLFYGARIVGGELSHVGVADHAWVTGAELGELPMPPADVEVVTKVQRILSEKAEAAGRAHGR